MRWCLLSQLASGIVTVDGVAVLRTRGRNAVLGTERQGRVNLMLDQTRR